jgi:hypothetical protein
MQAVVVVRADVQGGGVERIVHGSGEVKEGSCSRISTLCGAVSRVIVRFNAFV